MLTAKGASDMAKEGKEMKIKEQLEKLSFKIEMAARNGKNSINRIGFLNQEMKKKLEDKKYIIIEKKFLFIPYTEIIWINEKKEG